MPRPKATVPAYRLHRASGQAVVYLGRREHYLGVFGSPESKQAYAKLLDDLSHGRDVERAAKPARAESDRFTVNEVLLRYCAERLPDYSRDEQHCQKGVIRVWRDLFGETDIDDFGPLRLRQVRQVLLDKGLSVGFCNRQVKRLRLIVKWAISFELCPAGVLESLATVVSMKDPTAGSRARHAIPEDDLQAVRETLTGQSRDLFDLMLLCGCRSGELVGLTSGDIDRTGEVWRADIARHKTSHFGKTRTLFFNQTAQLILRKYLSAKPDAKLFTIRRDYFGKVVKAACIKAGVKPFTPHWLRHTVATRLADEMGTEAAQRLLGHATKAMAEHYSKAAEKVAIEASKRLG